MSDPVRVTIFLTSDEHGFLRGAASLQEKVDQARRENPDGVLLLSAGDVFEGSPTSKLIGPEPSRELLKAAGYQAVALGNHDFDRGVAFTKQWVREAPCPVLNANVIDPASGELLGATRGHPPLRRRVPCEPRGRDRRALREADGGSHEAAGGHHLGSR